MSVMSAMERVILCKVMKAAPSVDTRRQSQNYLGNALSPPNKQLCYSISPPPTKLFSEMSGSIVPRAEGLRRIIDIKPLKILGQSLSQNKN